MTIRHRNLDLNDPDTTREVATALAPMLRPGDTILLSGDIGAGKTHFARSLITGLLPMPEDVPSPTFTLVQTYDTDDTQIWHADLYRLTSVAEIEELGLVEAFETAICIVEWPDRLDDLSPANALDITLTAGKADTARQASVRWTAPKWDERVAGLHG